MIQKHHSVRYIALVLLLSFSTIVACSSPGKRTAVGAGAGAVGGAGVGAAIGGKKGALIGAGVGAVAGGALGNYLDKRAKELAEVADAQRTANGILVNLKNDLLFETASADLKSDARQQLAELGKILAKYPEDRIAIKGHTDSVGTDTYNRSLSIQRANTVKRQLLLQGVQEPQLQAIGAGESEPVASNKSVTGRAMNRRVELIVNVDKVQG